MTEFETIKTALERIDSKLRITIYDEVNRAYIEDLTNEVDYWFEDGKLELVTNMKTSY